MRKIYTYPNKDVLNWKPADQYAEIKNSSNRNSSKLVTVIIPTLDEGTEIYRNILKDTIRETSCLIDSGAVSEVLVIDGSGSENRPDTNFDKKILGWAVEYSRDFRKQVEYIKSSRNEMAMANRFGFRFRYKILNQKNPEYYDQFVEYVGTKVKDFREIKERDIQKGKGSAIRLSIPASKGDILCCIDSDIKTCKSHYCLGLLMPFKHEGTKVTKASYIRKNTDGEMGGRIKRLVYDPFANAITKKGKFSGLETLDYGTAGEFAFRRSLANKLRLPNDFGLETSFNTQVYHHIHGNLRRIKQVDLGIFEHSSTYVNENRKTGFDPAMERMAKDISREWTTAALDTGLEVTEEELYNIYLDEVEGSIDHAIETLEKSEPARDMGIRYCGKELDIKRLENYKPHVRKGIAKGFDIFSNNQFLGPFPSWRDIKGKIGDNYKDFKEEFSKITGIYTLHLLEDLELI